MKKLRTLVLLLLTLWSNWLHASHLMGGEITWRCAGTSYIFTVKLYRACEGITAPPSVQLNTNAPVGAINCNPIAVNDLTPTGNGCPFCFPAPPVGTANAVEEHIYESAPIALNGVPPATGWYFAYTDCCRNTSITNLGNSGTGSFTLRALMYPYNGTNTNPCFDNSPQFSERPQMATCSGDTTLYNANAIDIELDSLTYSWASPLDGGSYATSSPYPFAFGYSANSPLPSTNQNPSNVAVTLHPSTGVVKFFSVTSGVFVTCTKVTAYKCGIKVAEVFREIQIALVAGCNQPNLPPVNGALNTAPDITNQANVNYYDVIDTVYAGDTVQYDIYAKDFEYLKNIIPLQLQSISLSATSVMFGTNYTSTTTGCLYPPCAVLMQLNGFPTPLIDTTPPIQPVWISGLMKFRFKWVTDCNHLDKTVGCTTAKSVYNFVFKVTDNFCPSPSVNFNTFTIVVKAPPAVLAARFKCLDVLPNGNTSLTFLPPKDVDGDTNKYFKSFYIYRSTTGTGGPYTLVDSVKGFNIMNYDTVIHYTDIGANANAGSVSYYITTGSGCDLLPREISDTLSTIYLNVSQVGNDASLTWNALEVPLHSSTTGKYYIWKEQAPAGSGLWSLIDSTASLTYLDPVTVCNDSINYRITVTDTSAANCISRSNIDGSTLQSALPVITSPSLRCVNVLANGDIQISWVGSQDTASYFDGYTVYQSTSAAGPFTNIGYVTNYAANTFTDVGANGQNQINYYYVTTTAGCDATNIDESTPPSNMLASMLLTANNPTMGFANLSWTPISTPLPPTSTGIYNVYKRIPPTVAWTLIGDTTGLSYQDTVILCDTIIEYKVELADAAGCISTSSIDGNNFTSLGEVLDNPELRCLAVQANGDVQLTWVATPDPNNFFAGTEIYHSSSLAGPYTKIGTVTSSATSYTHVGAGANGAIQYYYLKNLSGCDGITTNGSTSDTLRTMLLSVSNANLGFADLTWNALHTPNLASAGLQYKVMRRSTGIGAYVQIGTTTSLTFRDTITTCNVPFEYRIELDDNAPCTSISSADNDVFTYLGNVINNPVLHCVSVNANGTIQLTWENPTPSSWLNFNEYEVWRNSGAGFALIDSVSGSGTTTYTDILANGNTQAYTYYLVTQSGCTGQVTNGGIGNSLSSIYLTTAGVVGQANLNWTALSTPLPGTSTTGQYTIYNTYNAAGTLQLIGDTALLVYQHPILHCDTLISHQVWVNDNLGCISKSNIASNTYTWLGNVVNNPDLRCVSVLNNGQIQLTWLAPSGSSGEFNEYEIWRNNGTGFVKYDSVGTFSQTTWTDVNANGNAQSYGYYMLAQSGCTGQVNSPANSNTLNSIYLTTNNSTLGSAIMNWSALPAQLTSAATGYDVWSSYPNGAALSIISSTTGLTANEAITNCDTTLRHQITLTDASGCISRSNIDTNTFTWAGNVVNNPDLRCVSVLTNGQIQLTWLTPSGSNGEFNEYEIWRNNGAGFVLYDSVSNFNQTTWTDVNANGNSQSYEYYMLSKSGCTGQVNSPANSNSLKSIYLTTSNATLGSAVLNWNNMPLIASSAATGYDVWSSYPNGAALSIISSTTGLTSNEAITDCDTTLRHQITLTDASGCISRSNIDTNSFTYIGNVINHPELRCASVLPNGQVQLTWVNPTPTTWDDFNQYNIWRNTGAGFVLIDSVETNSITGYLDATANGNAGSISYYLQTKSGCTGQTDPSAIGGSAIGNTLRTIFLVVSGGNTVTATLNWNAVSNPLLATASGTYTIEREYPGGSGNWSTAGTTSQTTWQEPLTLCIDSVNYRVSTGDAQGCTSMSNVDGEIFVDHHIPAPPSTRCASVQVNGNVDLSWVVPTDTGQGFANYMIYRAASAGGPYTLLTTITNYATSSFTDNTVNAQSGSYYYYITTQTSCGGETSPGSDTLKTIKVDVFNNNGVAVITWNPLHNPELATATQTYTVIKEYPAGVWNTIGTTTAPVYQWFDTINVCSAVINYRVETGDAIGCISRSSIDGDLFRDVTRPDVALLDTVSLDPLNPSQVSVSWLPSPSGDVVGYIVYHFNGASWDSIGGLNSATASYFLHNNPAAALASQRYSIAAFDSCGNVSNIGVSHNTLFITAKLDICRSAIDVRWNPYINMVGGVNQYNIYMSENGGPYSYLASVPGTSVTYSHTTLNNGSEYCYFVQAQGNTVSRTASSNTACEIANLLTLPTFSYLKKATVIDLRRVIVECFVDTAGSPDVSRYKLQRSFDKNGPFTTVSAISYTGSPIITFNDFSARTDQFSYYYRMITIDSCGNEVLTSNLGRTILLTGQPDFNLVNQMKWNIYEEWLGDVSNYSLYRSVDGIWSPTPIAIVNNGTVQYDDNIADLYKFPNYSGKFCYRIEAYEGPGNTYGFSDTSISNEFCLVQEPHLFIPSAFTPDGKNPIFKPEFIYIDAKNFYFVVYNRWGQKVYETRIPGDGWDGTYQGLVAPEGTYAYTVRIYGTNGQEIEKSGSVTLLR